MRFKIGEIYENRKGKYKLLDIVKVHDKERQLVRTKRSLRLGDSCDDFIMKMNPKKEALYIINNEGAGVQFCFRCPCLSYEYENREVRRNEKNMLKVEYVDTGEKAMLTPHRQRVIMENMAREKEDANS